MKFQSKLLHILVCLSFISLFVESKVLTEAEVNDLIVSRIRCGRFLNKSLANVCAATVGQISDIRDKMLRRQTRSSCK